VPPAALPPDDAARAAAHAALEELPIIAFERDADGHCTFVNAEWRRVTGMALADALGTGWLGAIHPEDRDRVRRRLDEAVAHGRSFAFETTLGGRSVPARLRAASRTHEVLVWFCGLASPELHLARVRQRVAAGGHDIPEAKVRERWHAAIANLIALLPQLAEVRLFDNSASVAPGQPVPDPRPVAVIQRGRLAWPAADDAARLARTPDWAKPVLEAALAG